jgi:hypothetical protein
MNMETFVAQHEPTRPLSFINIAVEHDMLGAFQEAFGVDYFSYRAEVRRIAQSSLDAVKNVSVSIGFADFERWFGDPSDEFLFPIDDDDLYHPELARTLDPVQEDSILILWDTVEVGIRFHGPDPVCNRYFWPALTANNWAIRKSFLKKHFDAQGAARFLSDHEFAQRFLVDYFGVDTSWIPPGPLQSFAPLAQPGVVMQADCYGVNFVHVGSLFFFWGVLSKGAPRQIYREYNIDKPVEVADYVAWADPYMKLLSTVIPRLRAARAVGDLEVSAPAV